MLKNEKANTSKNLLLHSDIGFLGNSKTITEIEKFSTFIVLEESIYRDVR